MATLTHFEIYGEHPVVLADFYRNAFGRMVGSGRARSAIIPAGGGDQ